MQRSPRVNRSSAPRTSRGVSLVELMIGLVVGLIITLAITSSVSTIGKQFRITGAGHSAAEGAQVAVALMDRDLRGAGAALFNGSFANLCPGFNMYDKGVVTANNSNLYSLHYPVRIESGGPSGPDIVNIMVGVPKFYSGEILPIVKEMPSSSDIMKISDPNLASEDQLHVGDIVLVVPVPPPPPEKPTLPCTRFKVTKISGQTQSDQCTNFKAGCNVHFGSTSGDAVKDFNPVNPNTTYTKPVAYEAGSLVFKMPPTWAEPKFQYREYAVACGALLAYPTGFPKNVDGKDLRENCPDSSGLSYKDYAIAADIVMLKAQYGIPSFSTSDYIGPDDWVDPALPITAERLQQVKAIRIAIVARSREPDTGIVTAQELRVFDDTVPLNLGGAPVPDGKTWRNYRYRVHETVVPLRNPLWNR